MVTRKCAERLTERQSWLGRGEILAKGKNNGGRSGGKGGGKAKAMKYPISRPKGQRKRHADIIGAIMGQTEGLLGTLELESYNVPQESVVDVDKRAKLLILILVVWIM